MATGLDLVKKGLEAIAIELQAAQAPRYILIGLDFSVLAQGAECDRYLARLDGDALWVEKRHITPIKTAITVRGEMQPYSTAEVIAYLIRVDMA